MKVLVKVEMVLREVGAILVQSDVLFLVVRKGVKLKVSGGGVSGFPLGIVGGPYRLVCYNYGDRRHVQRFCTVGLRQALSEVQVYWRMTIGYVRLVVGTLLVRNNDIGAGTYWNGRQSQGESKGWDYFFLSSYNHAFTICYSREAYMTPESKDTVIMYLNGMQGNQHKL